ncbi:MAG: aspartate--tRNA ligase [Candidatus Colwellbacteria bacterium]|nr:aspartate--tRNA ligase [Candidatus Colwellbacteria bacterium]
MRILSSEVLRRIDQEVELAGWVDARRDHGKLIFIDLRDRKGIVQLVFSAKDEELRKQADRLRPEWVIQAKGTVAKRPADMVNAELETGELEVQVSELQILAEAETPLFPLDDEGYEINEELRLKYRYLDLRRPRLQKNIKLRSEFIRRIREFLFSKDFIEIETPLLTKATPEGARDFIVPARLQPGKFFALPQSPQQYKQLLMIAGFERYFQIARAIRDEDLRADRGFEHTQIDLEMSFVEQKDVMALDEEMITNVVETMGYKIKEKPFPVLSYKEAVDKFSEDKFDLRTEEEKKNGILAFAWVVDFPFFEKDKYNINEGRWTFTHNPFSEPKAEHIDWLLKGENIEEILTSQYDLVCNGYEVGGGSIRANKPEILRAVFKVMGYEDKKIEKEFGHMLEAFRFGAPPHGGIAHGVERLIMVLAGEEYLREVQAFPQTGSGRTSVMDAPSEVDEKQLKELGIKVIKKK